MAITLGPFSIPLAVLALVLGYAAFVLVNALVFRKDKPQGSAVESAWGGGFLVGFLFWKLSPFFGNPGRYLAEPLLLLYAPPSTLGIVGGVVLGIGMIIFLLRKRILALRGFKDGVPYLVPALAGLSVWLIVSIVPGIFSTPSPVPGQVSPLVLDQYQGDTGVGLRGDIMDTQGRVVVLNFWATWCPPCRAEIPGMVAYWEGAHGDALEIRAINASNTEKGLSGVIDFVKTMGMNFPVYFDTQGEAQSRFNVTSLPTTIVLNAEGQVIDRRVGVISEVDLENWSRR